MPQYQGIWTLQDAARLQSQQQWATDPLYRNTTLLLQADNAPNAAQNNTFLDSSANAFTITRNGNTTQGTFTPFSATGWSAYLVSSGSTLAGVYLNGESDFAFNGDFTIEFFVNLASSGASQILYDQRPALTNGVYPTIYLDNSVTKLKFYVNGADRIVQTSTFTYNVWHHVVVTRTSTSTKMFIDGVQEGSTYTDTNSYLNVSLRPYTSNGYAPDSGVVGYISNLRVVKGSGPYQSAGSTISVPTAQLTPVTNTVLLTLQSNRYVDTNTQAAPKTVNAQNAISIQAFAPFAPQFQYTPTVIGGSGYFDGTGDYLSYANSATVTPSGTENFTLECWVYPTVASSYHCVYAAGWPLQLYVITGNVEIYVSSTDSSGGYFITGGTGPNGVMGTNRWTHVAVVRNGNSFNVYLNGVAGTTYTSSNSIFASTSDVNIGRFGPTAVYPYTGYISNLRIVRGTAVYTSNFTPPTAPLTAVSGTSTLINFTNAAITDGTMKNNLETVGNAQVSTSVVKYGSGSMYMAAATADTDYLVTPASRFVEFGTGDFTIEMWIRPDSITTSWGTGSLATLLDTDAATGTGTDWWAIHQNNAALNFSSNSASILTSSSVLTATTWQHVALVRSNGSLTFYVNGTSAGSTTYTTTVGGNRRLFIGTQPTYNRWYKGYIDDLRITKGIARYTANFTPPQVALPRQ